MLPRPKSTPRVDRCHPPSGRRGLGVVLLIRIALAFEQQVAAVVEADDEVWAVSVRLAEVEVRDLQEQLVVLDPCSDVRVRVQHGAYLSLQA
jgi:hypothetical protein